MGADADQESLWDWLRQGKDPGYMGGSAAIASPRYGGYGFAHRPGRGGRSHRHHWFPRRVAGSVIVGLVGMPLAVIYAWP